MNFPDPTASDNCTNPPAVECAPPSGSLFDEGISPVACTATDASNLSSGCGFVVTVEAGEGPPPAPSVLEIPTASSIGLAGLALLLAGAGLLLLRRVP